MDQINKLALLVCFCIDLIPSKPLAFIGFQLKFFYIPLLYDMIPTYFRNLSSFRESLVVTHLVKNDLTLKWLRVLEQQPIEILKQILSENYCASKAVCLSVCVLFLFCFFEESSVNYNAAKKSTFGPSVSTILKNCFPGQGNNYPTHVILDKIVSHILEK